MTTFMPRSMGDGVVPEVAAVIDVVAAEEVVQEEEAAEVVAEMVECETDHQPDSIIVDHHPNGVEEEEEEGEAQWGNFFKI